MQIAIGADHRGYDQKEEIKREIGKLHPSVKWIDVGTYNKERTDYPIYVTKVCDELLSGATKLGILLCGSGVGMSIAANRHPKIYAALVWNEEVARMSKSDDNANVLVLPADFISKECAVAIVNAWLTTQFKGGRYQERLQMIDQ